MDDNDAGRKTAWTAAELHGLLRVGSRGLHFFDPVAFVQRAKSTNTNAVVGSRNDLLDDLGNLHAIRLAVRWMVASTVDDFYLGPSSLRVVAKSGRTTSGEYDGGDDLPLAWLGTYDSACTPCSLGLPGRHGAWRGDLFRRCVLFDVRSRWPLLSFGLAFGGYRRCTMSLSSDCPLRSAGVTQAGWSLKL